jgi:hypothetical protein
VSEDRSALVWIDHGTEPLGRFLEEHARLMGFVGFVSALATRADEVVRIARTTLIELGEETVASEPEERGAVDELRRNRQLVLEMTQSRAVDNFLVFVSELLALSYRARPEMLLSRLRDAPGQQAREQESVPLQLVLEHETIDELLEALVERRVTALAYRGVGDLQTYLDGQLGLKLFDSAESLARAVELVEQRNLIAHNRGVINNLFLARVPDASTYELGAKLVLKVNEVFDGVEFLAKSAVAIDGRAAEKWNLSTGPFALDET